jgi:Na+/proline symporter/signal transduction histidine kinase
MHNLHYLDIFIIFGYLVLCLFIGLYKAGKIRNIRDYALGSGKISSTVLIFTILATYLGAGSTIGTVEKLYSMGLIFALAILFKPLFWLITAKIFSGNIEAFKKAGCMSVSDIMGFLYGKTGKWATNLLAIFISVGVLAGQIAATGYLFNYFFGISHLQGVLIGFSVLATYSLFGGIRAVALTDTFQGLIIILGIPIACVIAFHEIGGYQGLVSHLPESHLSIDLSEHNGILFASILFYTLMPLSEGTFIQRFLMANDSKQLNRSLKAIAIISFPLTLVIALIGFIVKAKAPEIDPNTAFFYLIGNYLPIGITGLLITGVLAALMSTADSWLNTASVLCAHDVAKTLFPKLTDKQELLIARIAVGVISMISMCIAFAEKSLMGIIWMADNFWFPVVLIPLAAGFLKFKTNNRSFIVSAIFAISGVLIGRYVTGEFATISLLIGAISSAVGLFGAHYIQGVKLDTDDIFSVVGNKNHYQPTTKFEIFVSKQIKEQISRYRDYAYLLSGLGMIYFLGSSFFMAFTEMNVVYVIVYLKAVAAVLCFGLCIYEFHLTPKQQDKYMPIYWNIVLLYCFPFLSAYIAFVYDGTMPWMINLMLSTILLYVFGGWFSTVFLSILGFIAAYLLFKFTGYTLALVDIGEQQKMLGYIYCLLTAGIILILKHRDVLQEKALETRMLYGAAVAHEVINPLQSAAMIADTILNVYEGKTAKDIKEEEFQEIKALLRPFRKTTADALKTVDRMLTLVRKDIGQAEDIGSYDIHDCVVDALRYYGLDKDDNKVSVIKSNNFKFIGSKHFVGHLIVNLISNSLKYSGPNSKIEIFYENNELHFKDNGYGIDPNKLETIFEPFDMKGSIIGTGVGLPFCKRVMETMNGSIECRSELGKGAEFILKFN